MNSVNSNQESGSSVSSSDSNNNKNNKKKNRRSTTSSHVDHSNHQKNKSIRDDFQGTASFIQNHWNLLQYNGQNTLIIDDNVEEMIGWAIHMDGSTRSPSSLVSLPSTNTNDSINHVPNNQDDTPTNKDDDHSKENNKHENKKRKRSTNIMETGTGLANVSVSSSSSSSSAMLRSLPNIPIRPSILQYIHDCFVETMQKMNPSSKDDKDYDDDLCWESFDTSALVTLGIVVEEILTTALIPLADMHVYRCQHIIDISTSTDQWTLPPIEAIQKLMHSRSSSFINPLGTLPTTRLPARIWKDISTTTNEQSTEQEDLFQTIIPSWFHRHQTTLEQVQELWYLYKYFLPSCLEPSLDDDRTDNNKSKKQSRTLKKNDTNDMSLDDNNTTTTITPIPNEEELLIENETTMSYAEV